MATQVSLTDGAVASAGALAIQTNGTTQAVSISTGQVATLAQNPILTSGTANGVAYLNGSKAVTSGSALVFDGATLGVGVTPSVWGGSGVKALDVAVSTSIAGSAGSADMYGNAYFNGSNFVFKANGYAFRYQQNIGSGFHAWSTSNNGTAGGTPSFTQAMTLDASGNLLVGATSGSGLGSSKIYVLTNNQNGIISQQSVTGSYCYLSNALTNGGTFYHFQFNENGTARGSITSNGSTTAYNTTSDYRLKNITGPITGAKDFIMALQPKQGTWKSDGSKFVGFLAHEFQEVSPSSVTGQKDAVDADGNPIMQAMQASSSEVMANLIALVQEQQALITQLQADVAALKGA